MDMDGREEPNPSLPKLSTPSKALKMNVPATEYNLHYFQTSHGDQPCLPCSWDQCGGNHGNTLTAFFENVYCLISSRPAVLFDIIHFSSFTVNCLTIFTWWLENQTFWLPRLVSSRPSNINSFYSSFHFRTCLSLNLFFPPSLLYVFFFFLMSKAKSPLYLYLFVSWTISLQLPSFQGQLQGWVTYAITQDLRLKRARNLV